ncbi:senescence-associated carboxylesterase 101-like isoform X2 [Nymphaea colorata]|uniref:senescence-associated carboxylesterase 101-like isoform X2 n=1 Tax=Nymphaea colorata TaxID=210225 RepID=UPI00129E4098|nr:senescence-associated carboxylesterase 101-like isoform X2 [Nymphaea colorata]
MEASWKFSGGVAKANLILSSTRILHRAWEFISQIQQSPRSISFAIRELPRFTILAFNSPSRRQDVLPNLESLVDSHPLSFLITKDNPSVALDSFPLSTFCTLLKRPDLTDKLKTLTAKNQPRLIVVGHAEGGAVAALFTLWLLKNRSSAALPLCITYGSPFIGNKGLQTAIGKMEQSKSQFWHVLSLDDPVISSCGFLESAELQFKPFGTYLLLSESGYACIDDPDSVIELLRSADSAQTEPKDYGAMLQQQEQSTKYRKCNVLLTPSYDSQKVDLALQLQTLEIGNNQQQGEDALLQAMEKRHRSEWKKPTHNPKKLNNMKKKMAQLEWFMKFCKKGGYNYYDYYKRSQTFGREEVNVRTDIKTFLVDYWEKEVKKVENKPQTQEAPFRDSWLFGGNNCRRMVEPLHIAEYYTKGGKDYLKHREPHFAKLEGWEQADSAKKEKTGAAPMKEEPKGKSAPPNVTHDSCFWAHVEEAALKLPDLENGGEAKKEEIRQELREFEDYVMKLVNDYWLSPDAFFEGSSFMVWWRRYWEMLQRVEPDSDRDSRPFIVFMSKDGYLNYVNSAQ